MPPTATLPPIAAAGASAARGCHLLRIDGNTDFISFHLSLDNGDESATTAEPVVAQATFCLLDRRPSAAGAVLHHHHHHQRLLGEQVTGVRLREGEAGELGVRAHQRRLPPSDAINTDFISFHLSLDDGDESATTAEPVVVQATPSASTAAGSRSPKPSYTITTPNDFSVNKSWGDERFIEREKMESSESELINDDCLVPHLRMPRQRHGGGSWVAVFHGGAPGTKNHGRIPWRSSWNQEPWPYSCPTKNRIIRIRS
uniref:MATH domain containing protein n=1 Tax=Oryza sativa subsp. japonica TaxID=39947 RepID=Q8W365_ORYSJ|nr:putative MATH domain containing protein [Oryza sativa Japonica Group]